MGHTTGSKTCQQQRVVLALSACAPNLKEVDLTLGLSSGTMEDSRKGCALF